MRAFLTIVIIVAIVLAGYYLIKRSQNSATVTPTETESYTETPTGTATPVPTAVQSLNLNLSAQNNSGETGVAVLTADGSKTKVVLTMTGGPTAAQPAHIHTGSCDNLGGIKYSLNSVVNGVSTTTVNVSLSTLLNQLPLAINVHKSSSDIGTYVACTDITM